MYENNNNNVNINNKELLELYLNHYNPPPVSKDPIYDNLAKHKRSNIFPFNDIGGILPYNPESNFNTSYKDFTNKISNYNKDFESKEKFYNEIKENNKNEIEFLNNQNKADHIKKIDQALNFKLLPSTYTETHEWTEDKDYETNHPDDLYHYKKNFIKTYEECKIKHKFLFRK